MGVRFISIPCALVLCFSAAFIHVARSPELQQSIPSSQAETLEMLANGRNFVVSWYDSKRTKSLQSLFMEVTSNLQELALDASNVAKNSGAVAVDATLRLVSDARNRTSEFYQNIDAETTWQMMNEMKAQAKQQAAKLYQEFDAESTLQMMHDKKTQAKHLLAELYQNFNAASTWQEKVAVLSGRSAAPFAVVLMIGALSILAVARIVLRSLVRRQPVVELPHVEPEPVVPVQHVVPAPLQETRSASEFKRLRRGRAESPAPRVANDENAPPSVNTLLLDRLNCGTKEELSKLAGLGEKSVQMLLQYRSDQGQIASVDELVTKVGMRSIVFTNFRKQQAF